MQHIGYAQLMVYLALYSVIGWVIETAVCSVQAKRFVNRGFLFGPYCPIYGVGGALILLITSPFADRAALVFLVALLSTSVLEYATGWAMEALFQMRWWDYSHRRFNLHGRVCLGNAALFGLMGLLVVYVLQPVFGPLIASISDSNMLLIGSAIVALFLIDLAFTLNSLVGIRERLIQIGGRALIDMEVRIESATGKARDLAAETTGRAREFAQETTGKARERVRYLRSYPHMRATRKQASPAMDRPQFYRMFWVFLAASVLGYLIETVYCFAASGEISSRQGLIYGPFNQIYGFGAVLMALILPRFARKSEHWLFLGSALLGGAFEYLCSFAQEKAFHSVSWEYSGQAFSLGGRTSLMYMLFWGILGYVFIKDILPWLTRLFERIPRRQSIFFSWLLIALLLGDMALSATAVLRWHERETANAAPASAYARFLDAHYPDARMREVYPGMVWRGNGDPE